MLSFIASKISNQDYSIQSQMSCLEEEDQAAWEDATTSSSYAISDKIESTRGKTTP